MGYGELTADVERFAFLAFADRIVHLTFDDGIVVFATDVVDDLLLDEREKL